MDKIKHTATNQAEDTAEARCGICKHFEPNFHLCNHPDINISVEGNSVCNNPRRFEDDV